MVTVKVKICGLTNARDALEAVEAGADALGFMFCDTSQRYVTIETAAQVIRELPPFVARVGIFVDPSKDYVLRTIEESGIDTLQFHGRETPEFCRQFKMKSIKAFRIQDESSLAALPAFDREAWLLDSFVSGQQGGTGRAFPWELAVAARRLGSRIILAGGLNPTNVAHAVEQVRPFGVDVSSGVESAPGRKDAAKVREFIRAAKSFTPDTDES